MNTNRSIDTTSRLPGNRAEKSADVFPRLIRLEAALDLGRFMNFTSGLTRMKFRDTPQSRNGEVTVPEPSS
jgi:hypothetical protein